MPLEESCGLSAVTQKESEIQSEFRRLEKARLELRENINFLQQKLKPVLADNLPSECSDASKPVLSAQLSRELRQATDDIYTLSAWIVDITNRMQI